MQGAEFPACPGRGIWFGVWERHGGQHGGPSWNSAPRFAGVLYSWHYMQRRRIPPELASPAEGSWSGYLGIGTDLWEMASYASPQVFNWVGDVGVPGGSPVL